MHTLSKKIRRRSFPFCFQLTVALLVRYRRNRDPGHPKRIKPIAGCESSTSAPTLIQSGIHTGEGAGVESFGGRVAWGKLDDRMTFHEKIVEAGNAATGVWARSIAWSSHHLSDGHIPDKIARLVAGGSRGALASLVRSHLFTSCTGGYQINNYLKYNPSRVEVLEKREKERLRKGGKSAGNPGGRDAASDHPDPTRPDPTRPHTIDQANGSGLMLGDINQRSEEVFGPRGFIGAKWHPKLKPHLPYTPDEVESAIKEAQGTDPEAAGGGLVAAILLRYRRKPTRSARPGRALPPVKPLEFIDPPPLEVEK